MLKLLLLSLLLFQTLLFSNPLELTPQERHFIAQHPTLTLGVGSEWVPYILQKEDGNLTGYYQEVIDEMNQLSPLKIQLIALPWDEAQKKADQKEIDGLLALIQTPQREEKFLFTHTFSHLKKFIYVKKDNPLKIYSAKDLVHKTIAVDRSNKGDREIVKQFSESFIRYAYSYKDSFEMVLFGDADAVLGDSATEYFLAVNHLPQMDIAFDTNISLDLKIAVQKALPQAQTILNKLLAHLNKERLKQLQERWFIQNSANQSFTFTEKERRYLKQHPTLKVCMLENYMPYSSYKEGHYEGISCKLMHYLKENLSVKLEEVPIHSQTQALQLLKEGKCDIFPSFLPLEAIPSSGTTQSYDTQPLVIMTTDNKHFINKVDELTNRAVAVVENTPIYTLLKRHYPFLTLLPVKSIQEGLESLLSGKSYAYIDTLRRMTYMMKQHYYSNLKISGKLPEDISMNLLTHEEAPLLQSILRKSLRSLSTQTIETLLENWKEEEKKAPLLSHSILILLGTFLVILLLLAIWIYRLYQSKLKLESLALKDPLTHLLNRRALQNLIEQTTLKKQTHTTLCSVMMVDIDYFKKINDTYGHDVGDKALIFLAELLKTLSHPEDKVFRLGGEEFLIILKEKNQEEAFTLARIIQKNLAQTPLSLPTQEEPIYFTISIGIAQFTPPYTKTLHESILLADEALYRAKKSGRDCIVIA